MNGFNNYFYQQATIQPPDVDLKKAKKAYSTIGFALCGIILVLYIIAFTLAAVLPEDSWLNTSSWGMWLMNFVPMYAVAIPVGILLMRSVPSNPPEQRRYGGKAFFIALCITYFFTAAGSLVGNLLSMYLSGGTAENALNEYAMDTNPLKIVVMVILAPIIEEYVFRKQIIDRTVIYGEKTAVLFSGLLFGLFHTNMFQFFYAFLAGVLFSYVYVRTGRLRYPVILHVIVNFVGSVIAPYIISKIDYEAIEKLQSLDPEFHQEEINEIMTKIMPGYTMLMVYDLVFLGLAITGLVFFILRKKRVRWTPAKQQLPHVSVASTVYMNAGMIVFITVTAALTILSVFL